MNGPIFPVGDIDPRLAVHEEVVSVGSATGVPVAFPRGAAFLALLNGKEIVFPSINLALDAGGIRATGLDGASRPSHEAFWFGRSQFRRQTKLWVK